jgi:hypothetical protein
MMALDPAALLAVYDGKLRAYTPERVPAGYTIDQVGPLSRWTGPRSGFIVYRDLGGLEGRELDALIAEQIAHFRSTGVGEVE